MRERNDLIKKIYILKECLNFPLTQRILDNAGKIPWEIIENKHELGEEIRTSEDPLKEGKKILLLARQKGKFVKSCPCTPNYIRCNYSIINLALNCPLDCSYCILQGYLKDPFLIIHVNLEDLWKELDVYLEKRKHIKVRIGTGELADSLALDLICECSKELITYFRKKKNAILEFKTKTLNISHLLSLEPSSNIVFSWSLNSEKVAAEEEKGAPSIRERLEVASRISEIGFPVGFHFDPLIHYPGWEEDYERVVRALFERIDPSRIAWISLGCLRFPPRLKEIIHRRFPSTKIIYEEFIPGLDNKMRYFRLLRLRIYRKIVQLIRNLGGRKIPLYFCMENESIWKEIFNWVPKGEEIEMFLSSPPSFS